MTNYVDGFVLPVPIKNIERYKKVAKIAGKVWLEHGALEYYECIGDDIRPGKQTSFPLSVKLKKDEVVFFSWIVYKTRAHRNKVLKKVMSDPRIKKMGPELMPFDTQRMIYGGFRSVIKLISK